MRRQRRAWAVLAGPAVAGAAAVACLASPVGASPVPASTVPATTAPANAVPTTYTVTVNGTGPWANPDDTPANGFTDSDGQFYYQESDSEYGASDPHAWSFYTGSDFDTATGDSALDNAVNPANTSDSNADTIWRCDNSPTGLEATYAPSGSSYAEKNYCDLNGVWVDPDTGYWYGTVHNEFTPQPFSDGLHYDAIDYAVSTDKGKTWKIVGHIITSPYSTQRDDTAAFPEQTYDYGDGDPRLYVDTASGYFYVYYGSRIVDKGGSWQAFYEHVARAPISGKMATGTWSKWYDGKWSQPGVGGKESDVVPVSDATPKGYVSPADEYNPDTPGTAEQQVAAGETPATSPLFVMDITYDAYLGEYIGEPQAVDQSGNAPQQYYATSNLATQQWHLIGDTGGYTTASWYRWFLDSANKTSSNIVGESFRSYCSWACSSGSNNEYASVTIDGPAPSSPVRSGATYRISSGNGRSLAQVAGAEATTSVPGGQRALTGWTFTATGDGSYTITNAATGQVLGVNSSSDSGRAWGARPVVSSLNGGSPSVGQEWFVVRNTSPASGAPTGTYRLVNRYSGLVIGLSAGPGSGAGSGGAGSGGAGSGGGVGLAETTPVRSWNDTSGSTIDAMRTVADQALTFTPAR